MMGTSKENNSFHMPLKTIANTDTQDNQELRPINFPKKLIAHSNIQFAELNPICQIENDMGPS